jgi:hypothetical protein
MNSVAATSPFNPSPSCERLDLNFFSEELMTVTQPYNLSFFSIVDARSRHPRRHPPLTPGHHRQLYPGRLRPFSTPRKLIRGSVELTYH